MENMGEKLINRLQRNERAAYMELYDFYFKRLHHFAVNFVFDYDVANDIVQSVFIKLYESISGFSADVNIGAYLCVMVRNRCLNYLRDQNIEDRHKILYLQAAEETETLSWIDDEELIRKIHAVIEKLPEKCREICELRFYKNMAENKPYNFVNGKTIQFMVPTDKDNEKAYKIGTKLSSTDMSLPAPLYLYDAGPGGALGAVVSNTASEGKYSTPCIIDEICTAVNEDDEVGTLIQFVGGQSVFAGDHIIYDQPTTNWKDRVDYSNIKVEDLKHGDIIEYTTSNDKVEMLRVIVRVDDIGPIRIDGDNIQLNGNMIADVISVADNGRTAVVKYVDRYGAEQYQSMLVNSTTYRYDSSDGEIYNSSASDLREGDRVLINSYWWSPKLVVIFR